ncbi:MAG: hypothetical protein WC527_08355 [Candidatus Margulisiibacteriota bacterium]
MRKYFALLFVVAFSASAFAAPIIKNIAASRMQTVDDIKKISFPFKPIAVTAQPESGSSDTTTSTYTPSDKYSTGSGVMLTPASLFEPECLSSLSLWNVDYNRTTQAEMNDAVAPSASISIPPRKLSSALLASVVFGRLAKETHTYVLTLKMDKTTSPGYIRIQIGDTSFTGDQVVYNPSTKEHRVLFSFAPPLSQMNILVYYVNSNQTSDAQIKFHYAQLVRLD